MGKSQIEKFVGIVEHLMEDGSLYHYCRLNLSSRGMTGFSNLEKLGGSIAHEYGENFIQKITYEPPERITKGVEMELCSQKYHHFSVLEKDRFEKAVLKELEGKGSETSF